MYVSERYVFFSMMLGVTHTHTHTHTSCPKVRMMYASWRDVAVPLVHGIDVGRWVADDPITTLTNPTRPCVWWGLHRLWTLRCQKAVRGMEVGTLSVVMAPEVTFAEARVWFFNTEQHDVANTAQKLSLWFRQHR